MVSAKEIYDFIDSFAPFDTAMDFDNVGILVGDSRCESDCVLLALDVSPSVIDEAVSCNSKIIVTHHPVIFNPIKKLYEQDVVYLAARHGITIISAHTNLDIAQSGVNETLAKAIGVEIQDHYPEDCALMGKVEATDCKDFAKSICEKLSLEGLRYTDTGSVIEKVMVSCGAGGSNIFLAARCGVQAFVTGEIKHHEIMFANSAGISVFDLGHYGSEDLIIPSLAVRLSVKFPEAVFRQAKADTDMIKYYSGGKNGS